MVDVGAEYDGSPFFSPPELARMESVPGMLTFSEYSGTFPPIFHDTSTRERDPSAMVTFPLRFGDESGPEFWPSVADSVAFDTWRKCDKLAFMFRGRSFNGITSLMDGMFNMRDKLARIGVVTTLTGVPLGNTDVILNGLEHREIVQTDERGVWWKYLEIDEYPGALCISPNGITYDLFKQVERVDNEGIFDQTVHPRTKANATCRQLHRRFV